MSQLNKYDQILQVIKNLNVSDKIKDSHINLLNWLNETVDDNIRDEQLDRFVTLLKVEYSSCSGIPTM